MGLCVSLTVVGCLGEPDPVRLLPAEQVRNTVIQSLQTANRTVAVEMYELGDPAVLEALSQAANRGLAVRVLADASEPYSRHGIEVLRRAGVEVRPVRVANGIDHVKLLTTDGGCLVGSVNWGPASWLNHDFDLWIPDPAHPICRECREHFEQDWSDGVKHRDDVGRWLFSGEYARSLLLTAMDRARTSVYVEMFELSDDNLLQALSRAANRGVGVHVLLDPNQPGRTAVQRRLAKAGVDVHLYRSRGERLHAKVLVVDARTVILGSANWTSRAFEANHELIVAFESPSIARNLIADWRTEAERIR
ncbi:MAG: phosphatidylserine/phosphatidylglycerophosphate/cardiolipin synthase family protein [Alicyclobacillaceae bacterium]|nr:phosphatidylserine/phosphatidylglycerophosphate/cardiolipin synthase family protein [Alicyclobacillaceae bacterium]